MKYGLTNEDLEGIKKTLSQFPAITKAVLFGSRALGNHRAGSDVDIAIYSDGMSFDQFLTLKIELGNLTILQELDIIRFETIKNPDLVDHINKVGIELYAQV